jgi:hypothetical protein
MRAKLTVAAFLTGGSLCWIGQRVRHQVRHGVILVGSGSCAQVHRVVRFPDGHR